MKLYKTKDDFIEIYSEEINKEDALPMDEFNEIGDYFMNTGYDYINENELLYAIENNLNWMDNYE
jgi:hypothetical protein